jgi:hypothetical protein
MRYYPLDLELNLLISKRLNIPIIDVLDLVQAYWMVRYREVVFKRSPRKLTIISEPSGALKMNTREVVVRKQEIWTYMRYSAKKRVLLEHLSITFISKDLYTSIIKKLWMPN